VDQDECFRRRFSAAKSERDEIIRLKAQAERRAALPQAVITPKKLAAFPSVIADLLRNGDIQFRKTCLRLLIGKVQLLDGEIHLSRPKAARLKPTWHVTPSGFPVFPLSAPVDRRQSRESVGGRRRISVAMSCSGRITLNEERTVSTTVRHCHSRPNWVYDIVPVRGARRNLMPDAKAVAHKRT